MASEKNKILSAFLAAVVTILMFFGLHSGGFMVTREKSSITVGFICDGDESTPYSENFLRSVDMLDMLYGDNVTVILRTNVPMSETDEALRELVSDGCDIVFSDTYDHSDYGESIKKLAAEYPGVQFCQAGCGNANDAPVLKNYHTFMGEIYEGRYASGKIAGLKLKEMIDGGVITEDEALVGFVAAYPYPEVISGYTAFLLGVRSECPTAVMRVRYTYTWSDYRLEKDTAKKLIDEGCVIISHHTDTAGTAAACENTDKKTPVYHIAYNQEMTMIAPNTSLTGTRIDWTPYIANAVEAVMKNRPIEEFVDGNIHGNDASGGFKDEWVKMLELNYLIAPKDADKVLDETVESFKNGTCHVFLGDYTGTDPNDPNDTIDLSTEYHENKDSSLPSFHYVLDNIITVEQDEDADKK